MTKNTKAFVKQNRLDGVTALPSEEKLLALGFSSHNPKQWYYSIPLTQSESFTLRLPKIPVTDDENGKTYEYEELVMDEYFCQPAYFGAMNPEYRQKITLKLIDVLAHLKKNSISIEVNPQEYGWSDWPENSPLTGAEADKANASKYNKPV